MLQASVDVVKSLKPRLYYLKDILKVPLHISDDRTI